MQEKIADVMSYSIFLNGNNRIHIFFFKYQLLILIIVKQI